MLCNLLETINKKHHGKCGFKSRSVVRKVAMPCHMLRSTYKQDLSNMGKTNETNFFLLISLLKHVAKSHVPSTYFVKKCKLFSVDFLN